MGQSSVTILTSGREKLTRVGETWYGGEGDARSGTPS